jgi:hypothetical protein
MVVRFVLEIACLTATAPVQTAGSVAKCEISVLRQPGIAACAPNKNRADQYPRLERPVEIASQS